MFDILPKESICKNCIWARKPWSEKLFNEGYIGCFKLLDMIKRSPSVSQDIAVLRIVSSGEFDEAATGWVSVARLNEKVSDNAFNNILLTKGCTKCAYHETEN